MSKNGIHFSFDVKRKTNQKSPKGITGSNYKSNKSL